MLFVQYPKCSTCKKAKKWLDEHNIEYQSRHIVEYNPQANEIREWYDLEIQKILAKQNGGISYDRQ